MRSRLAPRTALVAAILLFLLPPAALTAQSSDERRAERQEAARERDAERRERERDREADRRDRERDRCDSDESDHSGDCDDDASDANGRGVRTRIDTTVALDRRGEVNLSLVAGKIVVRGWDRAEARVRAQSEGSTLRFEHSASRLTISEQGRGRRGDDTRYEVTVPYGVRLVMRSTSGELTATDVRGEVEARTTSGDVRVDGASGRTLFESVSGDIDAHHLSGPVRGNSVSGSMRLDGVAGDVEAETVSGEITLNQSRSSFVRLETTSGDLEFDGAIDRAGRYEFNSHSGTITLGLPPDVGAQVSIETYSGDLDTAFPVTLAPNSGGRPHRFEFTLGGGGARVMAESFSGDINLQRASRPGASTPPRD